MIKDGIIQEKRIGEAEVIIDLIPETNVTSRPQTPLVVEYITIHNTGNKSADAKANSRYVKSTNNYVSWHFTVDDKVIIQQLPTDEVGYHAGDYTGNRKSIGIEICEHDGIDWIQVKENAAALIKYLMAEFRVQKKNIVPHQKWSGKYCPHRILDEGWEKFMALINMDWKEILNDKLDSPDEMIKAIEAVSKVADAIDLGDLEQLKYLPQMIEKVAE